METVVTLRAELRRLRDVGAPYRARVAVQDAIRAAERMEGPTVRTVAPRVCCAAAVVVSYDCTCGHVTSCAEHGVRHNGTHD